MAARTIGFLLLLAAFSCQFGYGLDLFPYLGYGEGFPSTPGKLDECGRRMSTEISGWDFYAGINPFYLRGDFDGDNRVDYIAQIVPEERRSEVCPDCSGVLFCMGSGAMDVLGSKLSSSDLDVDRQYAIGSKWGVVSAADSRVAWLRAEGEVVLVVWEDAASAIYLKEGEYRWHQLHEPDASGVQRQFLDDDKRTAPLPQGDSLDNLFMPGWVTDALAIGRSSTGLAEIAIKKKHRSWLSSLSFCGGNCGGKKILAVASDNEIKLWDPLSGRLIRSLEGHTNRIDWVAFSPDGRQFVSSNRDQIKLWDALSGRLIRTLEGSMGYVEASVAYSPDGKWLATGSDGDSVKLWDLVSGRQLRTFEGHKSTITSVAFSPDGRQLASASYDRSMKLWDPHSGQLIRSLETPTGQIESLAYSPDGMWLAAGSVDSSVKLWDPHSGRLIRTLEGSTGFVESLAYSPDGKRLASCGGHDQSVKLWDPLSGRLLRNLDGHTDFVKSVAFSQDGKQLASASIDGTVKVWGGGNETEITLAMFGGSEWIAFTPDGYYNSSDEIDSYVTFREGRKFLESEQYAPVGKRPEMIAGVLKNMDIGNISGTGQDLPEPLSQCMDRVNSETGGLRLRSHVTPLYLRGDFDGDNRIDHVVQVAPTNLPCPGCGGALFCFGSGEIEVVGKNLKSFPGALPLHLLAASWEALPVVDPRVASLQPDGEAVIMARANGPAIMYLKDGRYKWNSKESNNVGHLEKWSFPPGQRPSASAKGRALKELPASSARELPDRSIPDLKPVDALKMAYSPDGKQLASDHTDNSILIWDLVTGRPIRTLETTDYRVYSLAYGPNERRLAVAERNGVKLWNTVTGRHLRTLKSHSSQDPHVVVAYSPDGQQLASGTSESGGTIKLWDMASGRQLRTLESPWQWHGGRALTYRPDGQQLASAHGDRVMLWDAATGHHLRTLVGHWRPLESLTYSPNGKQLASGGHDYSVRVWDAITGRHLLTLRSHNSQVSHVAYSPDGRYLATSGTYSVKIWETKSGRHLRTLLVSQNDSVRFVAFTRDGRRLIAQSEGYLQVWGSGRKPAVSLVAFRGGGWASFTPDGHYDGSPEADLYMAQQMGKDSNEFEPHATMTRRPDLIAEALRQSDIRDSLKVQGDLEGVN